MSVEFTLTRNKLTLEQWGKLLADWSEGRDELLYDEPEFSEDSPATAYVWGPGSIRGVVLCFDKARRALDLRLGAAASREDWRMAFDILRAALKAGGGTVERETGEAYGPAELTARRAEAEAVKDFCFSVRSMAGSFAKSGKGSALLPLGAFSLPVTPADFPECTPETMEVVESRLAERVARYARAYRATVMTLKDGTKTACWALIPTLIMKVDTVSLPAAPEAGGMDVSFEVPWDRLIALLGPRAERLGEGYFLPELDEKKDRALLAAIRKEGKVSATDAPAAPAGGGEGESAPAANAGEAVVKLTKIVVRKLMENALSGGNPEDAQKKLVKSGLDKGLVENLTLLVATALKGMTEDEKNPAVLATEFIGQGVPPDMAIAVIETIIEEFKRQQG